MSSQESNLPYLADIEGVTDRVVRVMGGNPGAMQLQGTNTYLVGTGRSRILIDTAQGLPTWIKNLSSLLQERDIEISYVLLTHWHGDHVGGLPDLVLYDPKLASRIYKNQPDPGQQPIHNGQVFRTQGATIRAVHTPGHAVDHMCFVFEEEHALFTGDNVLGHGYSVVEDLGTYMKSLQLMKNQGCALGYPAHGLEIHDLPAKMQECIRHKTLRETQIHTALMAYKHSSKAGGRGKRSLTIQELVHMIYGSVPDEAYTQAVEPFTMEVLWKLAEDRKVGFEFQDGCRRWFVNEPLQQVSV